VRPKKQKAFNNNVNLIQQSQLNRMQEEIRVLSATLDHTRRQNPSVLQDEQQQELQL